MLDNHKLCFQCPKIEVSPLQVLVLISDCYIVVKLAEVDFWWDVTKGLRGREVVISELVSFFSTAVSTWVHRCCTPSLKVRSPHQVILDPSPQKSALPHITFKIFTPLPFTGKVRKGLKSKTWLKFLWFKIPFTSNSWTNWPKRNRLNCVLSK